MYRIVGCILVVAAGAGMGFSGSMRLSEQIRILEKLLQMVICLKGEIRCGNASLPDAFYGAAGRMNGKYREFLISAADRMKAGTGSTRWERVDLGVPTIRMVLELDASAPWRAMR